MQEFFKAVVNFDFAKLFREKTANSYIQFFRYVFVGGFAFLVDAFSLWLCEKWMYYMAAAAIAFFVGLGANYLLSILFVFSEAERTDNRIKEFVAYAAIGIIGLLLTELFMYVFTDICGFYFLISKVIAAIIVLIWNFVARKKILYSKRTEIK